MGRRTGTRAALVLPALVPTMLVLSAALGSALLQSIGLLPLVGNPQLNGGAFAAAGPDLARATELSLALATVATVVAAAVGLSAALTILNGRRSALIVGRLSALTIPLPHLIGAAAMGLLLADSGLIARLLGRTGAGFPELVAGPTWFAVIAEYAWKESAFIALVVAGTLAIRVSDLEQTAALLGAGRWQRLRYVTLPLAIPALAAASALSFVYVLGSYEVSWLLGRSYPEPLPVLGYRLFTSIELSDRPQAAAVAVITATLCVAVLAAAVAALRRSPAWR